MKISDHIQAKEFWKRRINPDAPEKHCPANAELYAQPTQFFSDNSYNFYTQEDFMRENDPSAHDINSRFMSMRPVYDVKEKEVIGEDGKVTKETEWHIVEFEPVETVRFGLQQRINTSKAAFMAGNGFWICHEDKDHELGEKLNSWKDRSSFVLDELSGYRPHNPIMLWRMVKKPVLTTGFLFATDSWLAFPHRRFYKTYPNPGSPC